MKPMTPASSDVIRVRKRTKKACARCKEVKPVSEFHKDKAKATGLTSFCKDCIAINRKKWRDDNKDHTNEYNRLRRRKVPTENRRAQTKHRWKKLGIDLTEDQIIAKWKAKITSALFVGTAFL